jgi:hypothetical protein
VSEGVFGTLVIHLPSDYVGGQRVIRHKSKSVEFDFGGPAGCTNFHYVAFYAGCQQEIEPITKGYQLCLIYNLVSREPGSVPMLPNNQSIVSSIALSMTEWNKDNPESKDLGPVPYHHPLMMTYMLQHEYNRYEMKSSGLSFKSLKGSDKAVANVLLLTKKKVEFDLFLAKVDVHQTLSAYGSVSSYDEGDITEEDASAENLRSPDGKFVRSIELNVRSIVPSDYFDDQDPDDENAEGDSWELDKVTIYKQHSGVALLLWPSKYRMKLLGIENVVHFLNKDLQCSSIGSDRMTELKSVAKDILRLCTLPRYSFNMSAEAYVSLLQCLQRFNKVELISKFFEVYLASGSGCCNLLSTSSFGEVVISISRKYGWGMLKSPLQAIFKKPLSGDGIVKYSNFLTKISQQPLTKVQKDICRELVSVVVKGLSKKQDARGFSMIGSYLPLLPALHSLGEEELLSQFLNAIASFFGGSSIEFNDFSTEVLSIGLMYGWDILRSPLQVIFNNSGSSVVDVSRYCDFLCKIFQQPFSDAQKDVCRDLIRMVMERLSIKHKFQAGSYVTLLQVVRAVDDTELLSQYLSAIASFHDKLIECHSFCDDILAIGLQYGWNILKSPLEVVFSDPLMSRVSIKKHCEFLYKISQNPSRIQKSVCQDLARVVVNTLYKEGDAAHASREPFHFHDDVTAFLTPLFRALQCLQSEESLSTLFQVLADKPNCYSVEYVLAPLCENLYQSLFEGEGGGEPLLQLLSYCISSLETFSSNYEPCWSMPVDFSCTCPDCQELVSFLKDGTKVQSQFKVCNKRRFDHLLRQLHGKHCSVSLSTKPVRKPRILIVTKTCEKKECQEKTLKATISRLQHMKTAVSHYQALSVHGEPPDKRQRLEE